MTNSSGELTQYGNHLIILNDLQGSRYHKAETVHAFACVVDEVPWSTVNGLKLHGKSPQTPIASQAERRMLFEHLPVEMDTNIRSHILRADLQHLKGNRKKGQSFTSKVPLMDVSFLIRFFCNNQTTKDDG